MTDPAVLALWQDTFRQSREALRSLPERDSLLRGVQQIMNDHHQPPPAVVENPPGPGEAYRKLYRRIQDAVAYALHRDGRQQAQRLSEALRSQFGTRLRSGDAPVATTSSSP
ncbi:hypothetical protein NGM37_22000, partial [Streptomyces sp. TRM76130]|nr:hypothetical protein [Streptomyces sp. TRM76130]